MSKKASKTDKKPVLVKPSKSSVLDFIDSRPKLPSTAIREGLISEHDNKRVNVTDGLFAIAAAIDAHTEAQKALARSLSTGFARVGTALDNVKDMMAEVFSPPVHDLDAALSTATLTEELESGDEDDPSKDV